jgi:hypothetical protein
MSTSRPRTEETLKVRVRELERQQRADRLGHDHADHHGDRELEIAVEREQDHEDQKNRERTDHGELLRAATYSLYSPPQSSR